MSIRSSSANRPGMRPAFTLIELLVVIAIIAILAAILFPVFAQAREKARQTQCLSNTRQIALGMMQYTQDFDETFPSRAFPNNIDSGCSNTTWWIDVPTKNSLVMPYIKNANVFHCPSNRADASSTGQTLAAYNYAYGYNGDLIAVGYTSGDCVGASTAIHPTIAMAQVKAPASMIMFGEDTFGNRTLYRPSQGRTTWGQNYTSIPGQNTAAITNKDIATNSNGIFPWGRHMGGVEEAFCDGHVKWVKPEALYNASATATSGNDCAYFNSIDDTPACANAAH